MAKPNKKEITPTLMPISVDVDLIRFERNLLNLGFFAATDPRNEVQTLRRIEKEISRNGHKVRVAAEFRGSAEYGLPTTTDRDKFIAFLKIMNEDRAMRGKVTNPVRFSGYRMVQELGLTRHAGIYEDIMRWGKRMTDTTITSEQVVFHASKKVFLDDTLHVFNRFRRTGTSNLDDTDRQEGYEVELAEWFLENLNQRFAVPEDFNAYKKLKRPISKGIFGFLHLGFHASSGRPIEKDYKDLCNEMGVKSYPHLSKIKHTLGLALDELVKIKYLSKWEIRPMVTKNGYKIILTAGAELLRFLNKHNGERRLQADNGIEDRIMSAAELAGVQALLDHGVLPERASSLVQTYGAERVLDVVDYQVAQIQGKRSKIYNPAGLIIFSIENSLPIPVGFVTSRRQREIENESKAEEERRNREFQLEQAYMTWVDDVLEQEIAARFTPEVLQTKIQEIVTQRTQTDDLFRRVQPDQRKKLAAMLIRKEIRAELELPDLKDWSAGHSQGELFKMSN
jgi:hypothetical protein